MKTVGARRDRVELVATVLLAAATVATAWSGYQSTRWNGEQVKAGGRANALRIESAKAAGLANTQTEVDASPKLRVAMLCIGCTVFLLTALWIATSPVSLTV